MDPLEAASDAFAGADIEIAQRLGAVTWLAATAMGASLLVFAPPTARIGAWGWVATGLGIALSLAGAVRLWQAERPVSWNQLVVAAYVGLAQIALIQWLGGPGSPYRSLYVIVAMYVGGTQRGSRLVAFLTTLAALAFAPLVYDGWHRLIAGNVVITLMLCVSLAGIAAALLGRVRAQRLDLQLRGDVAEALAHVDALTRTGNRRAFDLTLEREISRARRAEVPLALALGDLDRFKQINDEHGHLAGDECLTRVADVLSEHLRAHDSCFRWGGDEFAVILPDTDAAGASALTGRVMRALACAPTPDGVTVAVSWGIAELAADDAPADVVARADAGLRAVKDGRDRSEGELAGR